MMKFDKIAELAGEITISDENKKLILQNCKRKYEERRKRRLLTMLLMSMGKAEYRILTDLI